MITIYSLPNEILYHIATMCQPITYYNFVLAYKQVYRVSRKHYKRLYIVEKYTDDTVYHCLLDGTLHGVCIKYANDIIVEYLNYHKGALDGFQFNYYHDGSIYQLNSYINGKLHGTCKQFYLNGSTAYEEKYDMGRLTYETHYYPNEKPRSIKYKKNNRAIHYRNNTILYKEKIFPLGRRQHVHIFN